MRIEWSEVAFEDLLAIQDFIARDSATYAVRFVERVLEAVEKLAEFPEIGRQVQEVGNPDIRELLVQNYRVMYQFRKKQETAYILTIVHGRRDIINQSPRPWDVL